MFGPKSATVTPIYHPSGVVASWQVVLKYDGEPVRADQFRTERGALRVVDRWFKV